MDINKLYTIPRKQLINLIAKHLWKIEYVIDFDTSKPEEKTEYFNKASQLLELVELFIKDEK